MMYIDNVAAKIMMNLIETAANDGVITKEEQEMLDSINNSLIYYKNALKEAYEDGIISIEEEQRLQKIKEIIISTARIVAETSNDEVTSDELNLLIGLMCTIKVPKVSR